MGFSGKPSKGCLPCRQKRTKCDLALPSCTQCVRKNRMCFGYRNEQDMVFRNETGLIIRKVKRKSSDGESSNSSSGSPFDEDAFATLELSALVAHPSRRATLQDEAIMHWMANFNEKFFSSSSVENLQAGFEYIMPIYQRDLEREGPAVEIVHACGLAALGNAKGAPDLLRAARVKQIRVLRKLNEQLQDPEHGLSDSSVLTCLLLSSFENMVCDGSESMAASQMHLRGAATLVKLRGKSQFSSMIGRGMFVRLRGSMLALSLLTSEPIPDYLFQHLEEEGLTEESFEVKFFRFMNRVCHLRSQHKHKGFIDPTMVAEAHATLHQISTWNPKFPPWVLPDGHRSQLKGKNVVPGMLTDGADKTNRFIWVAMSWLFLHIAEILVHELLIVYFRAQIEISPLDPDLRSSLQAAMAAQFEISLDVRDAVEYYLVNFQSTTMTTRSIGAHMLMMPLSILLGASTTSPQMYFWIAKTAGRIAETFALKQGKMVADFLMMGRKAEQFGQGKEKEPLSYTSTVFSNVGTLERTEVEVEVEGGGEAVGSGVGNGVGVGVGRERERGRGSGSEGSMVDGRSLPTPSPSPKAVGKTAGTTTTKTKSLQILIS